MIEPGLDGKVALVTGANHGIGAATAAALAAQGARVVIGFHRDEHPYTDDELAEANSKDVGGDALYRSMRQQSADLVVRQIRDQGGEAAAHEIDLAVADNIPRLFDLCESDFGPADVLVNNHTHCVLETFDPGRVDDRPGGVRRISAVEIDAHFAVNARAYALMMSEYVDRYLERDATSGRIINLSTDAAHLRTANVSYAASKRAIESYSRSAAAELGRYGITVNIVAPGPTQTGYITPETETQIAPDTPLGRLGRPDDLADVIVFLASDQARWVTGQLIYVGGGWRMRQ